MLRCALCGRPAGEDRDAVEVEQRSREQGKKPVWICPLCSGKARFEAEEGGHGLKGRDPKPV